jgi:hypothetical protein
LAYLDIDFTIPISVIAASIVGVVIVRWAAARGRRLAKARTQRLLSRYGGMSDTDRASIE